ncbi:XRE family transcriptional regulator (plasmid) [Streptomyces sp. NBC_00445]|uniref:helix-turn-helix transcriptional regulator n=1 Tax=Streptomyces sp. NBC_00445 TaxID=2975745 RepID=UPI002E1D1B01
MRGFQGEALRAACERRGMSEADLARATSLPASRIRAYVDGRRVPEWKTLATLSAALGSSVSDFRPGEATTLEDLRNAAGDSQATAAAVAGLGRSGYAMLENGHTRTMQHEVAKRLAEAWGVSADEVMRAQATAVQRVGAAPPVLQGALLEGLAGHFGLTPDALLELARRIQEQTGRRTP